MSRKLLFLSGWLLVGCIFWLGLHFLREEKGGVVFPMVEIAFRPDAETADPFVRELWGRIEHADGQGMWIPAFFDGDNTWKVRFSPRRKGKYRAEVFEEEDGRRIPASVTGLVPARFVVSGKPAGAGLVRIHPEHPRAFAREDGSAFYPVGMNIGWVMPELGDVVAFLEKLAAAEGNWSRIWMCHWDDKNLDWSQSKKIPPGALDLDAAKKWDHIVATAERLDIPFQMVLQHHGQYSTRVNPSWKENPWNKANGGFLEKPEQFFTDPQARLLTRRKFRYFVGRYGYSSAVMAWELFNEVEFTDASDTEEGRRAIHHWHVEMAAYLRSIDPYRHLITTSALPPEDAIWGVTDFVQQHLYPPDVLAGAAGFKVAPEALSRPIFYGEIGSMTDSGHTPGEGERDLRKILWGGMFAHNGAAAQFWAWDQVEREKLYPLITSMARFSKMASLGRGGWRSVEGAVTTGERGDLVFGPGQRWDSLVDPHLVLRRDGGGRPVGQGFSATLRPRRGSGEKPGTDSMTFYVELDRPARWEIVVNEVSKDGATLRMETDGHVMLERTWEPAPERGRGDEVPCKNGVDLPAGVQQLRITSNGKDHFQISSIRLTNYVPGLGVLAMTNDDRVVAWIYRQIALDRTPPLDSTVSGEVSLQGLLDGRYRATWWDIAKAGVLRTEECVVTKTQATLLTPPIHTDAALLLERLKP